MKSLITTTITVAIILFALSHAPLPSSTCSSKGYTISAINGVLTSREDAERNQAWLKYFVGETYNKESIDYQYLLNPSHVGGAGDLVDTVTEKLFENEAVADRDLIEIIKTASYNVKTKKLLLVAHSQGNFYANNFYDLVAGQEGGVPKESIGVYSVATPASRVAGGGKWLTSDTDSVIAKLVSFVTGRAIMPPNTHIPQELVGKGWFSGHDFVDAYLQYRGVKIVDDVQQSLGLLSGNEKQDTNKSCITTPKPYFGYEVVGLGVSTADFFAIPLEKAVEFVWNALSTIISSTYHYVVVVINSVSGNENSSASVILATHKLPKEPPVRTVDSNTSAQTATSTFENSLLFPSADSPVLRRNAASVATSTATSTPSSNQVASYISGSGGGSGAPSEDRDEAVDLPAPRILHPNGLISATTTAQSYTSGPVVVSGDYYNDGAFNAVAFEIKNTTFNTATSSVIFSAKATSTDNILNFSETIDIPSDGIWKYRVRLENQNNASSTPWLESDTFRFEFATTTATSTTEVAPTTREIVFEQPDLNTLSYSDLNLNGIPDSSEEDVIASTTMALPAGEYLFNNLTITGGATITAQGDPDSPKTFKGVKIFAKNLTIDVGAALSADGQGYGYHSGPGTSPERVEGVGASYGGDGYNNTNARAYGSYLHPIDLGSGSGISYGHGGGAIHLIITNMLFNDGSLSADSYGGATAGGSVYVETTSFLGKGALHSNGFALGSGGRISVRYQLTTFTGRTEAKGGCATPSNPWVVVCGQNGTVVFVDNKHNDLYLPSSFRISSASGQLNYNHIVIDGGNFSVGNDAPIKVSEIIVKKSGSLSFSSTSEIDITKITIDDNSTLVINTEQPFSVNSISITNRSSVYGSVEQVLFLLVKDLYVSSDSQISVNRMGYNQGFGPGAPSVYTSGASYGGAGFGADAKPTYGSAVHPVDFGSGGGAPYRGGGGAVRIVSSGTLINDGAITADGNDSSSGGSIYITSNIIGGAGTLASRGGNIYPYAPMSGPGGGGRIAVYYNVSNFTGLLTTAGGCGSYDGWSRVCAADGTVIFEKISDTLPASLSSVKAITSFDVPIATSTISGAIDESAHTISLSVPFGTDIHALEPLVGVSSLATSSPASLTPQDFTNPVTYTITAEDGSTQVYVVTVVVDPAPTIIMPAISTYTFNSTAGDITTDFASTTPPIELSLTANKNVDWVSVTIENQSDATKYKRFLSSTECIDGTSTCTKSWDGVLSGGEIAPNGTYRIKAHIKDSDGNEFNNYLLPYGIIINR